MNERINICISKYAREFILSTKPQDRNFSEWLEELAMRQIIEKSMMKKHQEVAKYGFEPPTFYNITKNNYSEISI